MVSSRLALSLAAVAFAAGSGVTYAASIAARVEVACPAPPAPASDAPPSRDWLAPPPPPVTGGARY